MTPEHHEERLCAWAEKTGRPVLSLDYGKAPECECNLLYLRQTPPMFWISGPHSVSGTWERNRKHCCDYLNNS